MSKINKHKSMMNGLGKCPIDNSYNGPLDRHHINGRKIPKWDEDWNIVYLSPNSHRLVHEGEIIIEGWFQTSSGRELFWHKKEKKAKLA